MTMIHARSCVGVASAWGWLGFRIVGWGWGPACPVSLVPRRVLEDDGWCREETYCWLGFFHTRVEGKPRE